MITKALLARFESRSGNDAAVENFLAQARTLVMQEPATTAWFAIRFGRGEYGIFDAFADEAGRQAHLDGAVAKALMGERDRLLEGGPTIRQIDVLAHKLPANLTNVTKGLLLELEAKDGHEEEVAAFLREARGFVEQEPGTLAWFALRFDARRFGIFDVFPDNGARFSHLIGHVPRELAKHALTLLGGMPDMDMLDVIAVDTRAAASG
jgi:quinol monooxygenase YgiN